MNTFSGLTQSSDPSNALPIRLVRHRPLTTSEVQTIWLMLSPISLPGETQEVHITLKQNPESSHSGWVIQLGQATGGV